MIIKRIEQGFTAVELLAAIIVGVTLLGAAYQLYSVSLSSTGASQRQTQASIAAYDILRSRQSSVTTNCAPYTTSQAVSTSAGLPGATATIVATCPYTDAKMTNVTVLTVTVRYDSNTKQVSRAIALVPQQ